MQTAIINVENVSFRYDNQSALNKLSLTINAGSITAILGENGAGKTTLFDLFLARRGLQQGKIELFDLPPGHSQNRQLIGVMLQQAEVAEQLTVAEHIQLQRSYYHCGFSIDSVLQLANLQSLAQRRVAKLSGGEKQRLMFALAICGDPELLILDEPTVALDVNSRQSFWQCLQRFKQQGKTVVLSTHYIEEADQLADYIVVLDQGHLVTSTTPIQLKAMQQQKQIDFYYDGCSQALQRLASSKQIEKGEGNRYSIHTTSPEILLQQLLKLTPMIGDLTVNSLSLEQAFSQCIAQRNNNQ